MRTDERSDSRVPRRSASDSTSSSARGPRKWCGRSLRCQTRRSSKSVPGRGAITTLLAAAARDGDRLRNRPRPRRIVAARRVRQTFASSRATSWRSRPMKSRRALAQLDRAPESIRVAGNLPYNVASPILFKLVELFGEGVPLADATVMLQREVATRLTASPGTKDYGVLTILIGRHASVEPVLQLPAGAFRPVPKVQSTLVRLRFHAPVPVRSRRAGLRVGHTSHLHAASKNTGERAARVPVEAWSVAGEAAARGWAGSSASARNADAR